MEKNRQIVLVSRPKGMPTMDQFRFVDSALPVAADGQALVRTLYISVDPYMRGRMNESKSYVPPFKLDEVITGGSVGQVVESKHAGLKPGDFVSGQWGWQLYTAADAERLIRIDPNLAP